MIFSLIYFMRKIRIYDLIFLWQKKLSYFADLKFCENDQKNAKVSALKVIYIITCSININYMVKKLSLS